MNHKPFKVTPNFGYLDYYYIFVNINYTVAKNPLKYLYRYL